MPCRCVVRSADSFAHEQVLMRMFSMVAQPCEKENCACPRPHVRMTSTKRQMLKATDAPTDLFAPTTELAELVCQGKLGVLRLRAPVLATL